MTTHPPQRSLSMLLPVSLLRAALHFDLDSSPFVSVPMGPPMETRDHQPNVDGPATQAPTARTSVPGTPQLQPIQIPGTPTNSHDYRFPKLLPRPCHPLPSARSTTGQLEMHYRGSMGPTDCFGLQNSICCTTTSVASENNRSSADAVLMKAAIQTLVHKGAIKEVCPVEDHFISTLFLVEKDKANNEYRPIINLKPLHRFVEDWSFPTEGLPVLCLLIQQHDYMMKLDLKDAYYVVPHSSGRPEVPPVYL